MVMKIVIIPIFDLLHEDHQAMKASYPGLFAWYDNMDEINTKIDKSNVLITNDL
jgi:hypothetical protein